MDLICKFVLKDGKVIGESIDVYDNHLIVKIGDEFFGIPMDCVVSVGRENVVVKDFDFERSREVGIRWVEEKSKPLSLEELKRLGL